jgi:hypothetical protein
MLSHASSVLSLVADFTNWSRNVEWRNSLHTNRIPEPMMPHTVCVLLSNYVRNTNKTPTYCSLTWSKPLILLTMIYSLLSSRNMVHHEHSLTSSNVCMTTSNYDLTTILRSWALHRVLSLVIQYAWFSYMLSGLYRKVKTFRSDLLYFTGLGFIT